MTLRVDYALTRQFAQGMCELCALAGGARTAVMRAEALWWRCHRRLIADRLVAAGWQVSHVMPDAQVQTHVLTGFAVLRPDGTIIYPAASDARAHSGPGP